MKLLNMPYYKIILIAFMLLPVITVGEEKVDCIPAKTEIDYLNLAGLTESTYIQLAFDISEQVGIFLYVIPLKHPQQGKTYFVESMFTACRILSLRLRSDNGDKAYVTLLKHEACKEHCGDASPISSAKAIIQWVPDTEQSIGDTDILTLHQTWWMRLYPEYMLKNQYANDIELLTQIAARGICKLEYDSGNGIDFDTCAKKRSGQSIVDFERSRKYK